MEWRNIVHLFGVIKEVFDNTENAPHRLLQIQNKYKKYV